ncbi:tetratricopeptide repeat protein [Phytohabitans aurantiacus]|uniref:Bacterial transcriptional activator domain-containing protein n=1 Tax=Phytohabitans aurantiacus TaxID=3016789 RepID=A0ABQ5QZD7_9ACTN|nr:tetratricopeptide repeat protein [Phytohabitans aurantiacus]GLH99382.1 hypothetical protein Pa4123_46580 [Phytohabitans aurantiacus]
MSPVLQAVRRPSEREGDAVGLGAAVPLTRFVGRVNEVAALTRRLDEARLVTLTGPGGGGKTRLAHAVCDRLRASQPQLSWVELAELDDPALLAQTVATAVGVTDALKLAPDRALVRHFHERAALLVLDNCEHLIDAVAGLVGRLLRACPQLRVLATSREPLAVAGETTWAVGGLSLPTAGAAVSASDLAGSEAVQLFVDRARLVHPTFDVTDRNAGTIAQLCRWLDGMPLALELAAARLRVLPLRQVVDRLDDAFSLLVAGMRDASPRHQTMRATLNWSYDLLSPPERELFATLSVFRGGFTAEAAEAVAAPAGRDQAFGDQVFGVLARLVEKSLVQVHSEGDERYRLLDVVRQYAEQRLGPGGPDAARRHAAWYLQVAERADAQLATDDQALWLDRLYRDQDNLRAALAWARRHDPPLGVRLAAALGRYCRVRGNYAEGREWLQAAVAAVDSGTPPAVHAKVLLGLGMLEFLLCEYDRAAARLRQALDLYDPAEEPRVVASALHVLGSIAREQGRYAAARARHEECLATWRRLDDPAGIARSLKSLGFTAWLEADYPRAHQLTSEALRRFRDLGDGEGIVGALVDLGAITYRQGDHAAARLLLRESLERSERLGSREGTAWSMEHLGLLAAAGADHPTAVRLLRGSLIAHYELGDRCRTASVLEELAGELALGPDARTAARLFAAATELRTAIGSPVPPCDRDEHERRRRAIEAAAGPSEVESAVVAVRAMPFDQAVAEAVAAADNLLRAPARVAPAAPSGLRVTALGRARVEVAGRVVGAEDWTYGKPRELFYYLLTRPGATKAEVGLALWPDASAKELRNSFHTGMKHLRRALGGQRWVRFVDGGYLIDRAQGVWYDVDEYERAAEQGLATGTIAALDAAASRYPGDFLTDVVVGGWADAPRERLRRRHEQVMLTLGHRQGQDRRYADAAETFARLVAHDPFLEAAHRGLMRCHIALGNRARAIRQYQDLVELLGTGIGTTPGPETTALYARLRGE